MCFLVLQMFFRSYNNTTNENKLQKGETQNILMYCTVYSTMYIIWQITKTDILYSVHKGKK